MSQNVLNHPPSDNYSNNHDSDDYVGGAPYVLLSRRYKVLNTLSDGGFGQTFLVEDTHMPSNRLCVLKQLKPVHNQSELRQTIQERFQREAATLEKLGEAHDQIPRLFAYFSEGDQFYLVEEWVEGLTLTQKVSQEGPLPEAAVKAILFELLPVIAYIHSQKIVHRDIKPDNIILRQQDGKPVLIDFGAVKETMKTLINGDTPRTRSIIVGTPGYMPSEQLAGRPVYASDIYSVGITAIYLLTGRVPQAIATNPQTGSLRWREYAPNVSRGFANFLDCAAHITPHSRFASVRDMQSVLNTLNMGQMSSHQIGHGQIGNLPIGNDSPSNPACFDPPAVQTVAPLSVQQTAIPSLPTVSQPAHQLDEDPSMPMPWKGAVMTGAMIGVSVLVGALAFTGRFSGIASKDSKIEDTPVEAVNAAVGDPVTPTDLSETTAANQEVPLQANTSAPAPASEVVSAPASAANANGTVIGQEGLKNIRSGAGLEHGVVASVGSGDRIQVIHRGRDADGYPWYQVTIPTGKTGWIAGQLIQIDGDATPAAKQPTQLSEPAPTSPPTPTPPTATTTAKPALDQASAPAPAPSPTSSSELARQPNATIVSPESGSKNIRSGPGTHYPMLHIAYPGDRIIIQDSAKDAGGYTWYEVSFPQSGAQGWIAAQLVDRD
ncbi:MAG: serine/threonine protein kinase [Cyanobacteria bacterium J06626_6]